MVAGVKPKVIGLYGLPGVGKTHLLSALRGGLNESEFSFHEGSAVLDIIVPGGLLAFHSSTEDVKEECRRQAIKYIAEQCISSGKTAIVTGHFMFWQEGENAETPVWTTADADTFTHILYVDTPPSVIAEQIQRDNVDNVRQRAAVSTGHLQKWRSEEERELRSLCHSNQIFFSLVDPKQPGKTATLLNDFHDHNETLNLTQAEQMLDDIVEAAGDSKLEMMLVFDADKTLAAEDAGSLYWQLRKPHEPDPLKSLFSSSNWGHSYAAFRQATLLFEEDADDQVFDGACDRVAQEVHMRPEFKRVLEQAAVLEHVGAVVITSGLRRIWEKVLEREGMSEVKIIGGGRIADGFVATGAVKGALVARLQDVHGLDVCAFGDSPLDMDMLRQADQAIVVVGDKVGRSETMDEAIAKAIDDQDFQARQMLLPSTASPRLNLTKLPAVQFDDDFTDSLLSHRFQVFKATDKPAAKLLMAAMRDASNAGPTLRNAHHRAGHYLATEYLSSPSVIGMETYEIEHVLGAKTAGHRLLNEQLTTIVPLMRGGEPMAFGINDAFPLASFVHAHDPADLQAKHLKGRTTVVLVDSVINTGGSVAKFVTHIRSLNKAIRIVVVACVVQKNAVAVDGKLAQAIATAGGKLSLVALRMSDNHFKGLGATDTGNRLFNTTYLE
ncbi:hypothetical protein LTR36_004042 [Oleoguttula mirabilis]|uniref:Phosphoribosyltransferase domain-containing protein n=1 Tax=Oleoguttula mirabilis TaxID=1507867 RepID=A0AAV9JHW3_9PEZI|nr:hypothetical protein LTR36_004042 [Oleoguttula mirabilis]